MKENNFESRPDIDALKKETFYKKHQEIICDLDGKKRLGWRFYDSPIEDYDINFKGVLPKGIENLDEYVKETYPDKKEHLIGIEIGGPGKRLFAKLAPDYFSKTVGFTLHDKFQDKANRSDSEKHQVVEADVFSRRKEGETIPGYQDIEKWIRDNGKADVIIEKMVAPIDAPYSDHLLLIIKRWYKLLNNGGTFFMELPSNYDYTDEIEVFLKQYQDIFDFQVDKKNFGNLAKGEIDGLYIRLRKLENAPDSIDELLK